VVVELHADGSFRQINPKVVSTDVDYIGYTSIFIAFYGDLPVKCKEKMKVSLILFGWSRRWYVVQATLCGSHGFLSGAVICFGLVWLFEIRRTRSDWKNITAGSQKSLADGPG